MPATGYCLDILVNGAVIVEVKAVETVLPVHKAQVLSYLRLSGKAVGLLLNFNVTRMKNGTWRMVNELEESKASASSALI